MSDENNDDDSNGQPAFRLVATIECPKCAQDVRVRIITNGLEVEDHHHEIPSGFVAGLEPIRAYDVDGKNLAIDYCVFRVTRRCKFSGAWLTR